MEALKKTIDYIEKRTKISKKGRVLLRIFSPNGKINCSFEL